MEPSIESKNSDSNYRLDIDGLRAVAVLSVVLFHAGVPFLKGGFVGVDIFFVISGYLIGAHVYSDIRRGQFKISDFYRKRAKRILPALLVVLLFCYIVALFILSPQELKIFGSFSVATIFSASNIFAWLHTNYFAPDTNQNPLLMTWSLGVEEQFYLIFPLLMLLFAKARRKYIFLGTLLVAAVSLAGCIAHTPSSPAATFYLLPTRAWELAVGVLLAIYEKGRPTESLYFGQRFRHVFSIAGLLLIAAAVLFFDSNTVFPGYAALLPVLGAASMITAPSGIANRLLSVAPFVFIGQISYSLYLWHWPLLSFARIISDGPITVALACGIAAVSIFFAWLSYRFVEQPCRRTKTPSRPLLIRFAILCALTAAPAMLFRVSGLPQRFPQLRQAEAYRDWELDHCPSTTSLNLIPACVDTQDLRPAIALIGDSHAQAVSQAMREFANHSGYKFYEIVRYECPPLTGVVLSGQDVKARECLEHNSQALSFLAQDSRVKVVMIADFWLAPEINDAKYIFINRPDSARNVAESHANLAHGLGDTISSLQSANKKIILLQDVPILTFDPLRRIRLMYIPVRRSIARLLFHLPDADGIAPRSETLSTKGDAMKALIAGVATRYHVAVFDPQNNICPEECIYYRNPLPVYFDYQHVTPVGGEIALTGLSLAEEGDFQSANSSEPSSTTPAHSWSSASSSRSSASSLRVSAPPAAAPQN